MSLEDAAGDEAESNGNDDGDHAGMKKEWLKTHLPMRVEPV